MSRNYVWGHSDTPPKCTLDRWAKQALVAKAETFLADFYRPTFLKPPPTDHPFNYITAFSARWHGAYLLFTATYSCLGPNALAPSFETNFARLGYFARDRFNLWARRHNDQWIVIASDLTLDAAFAEMRTNPRFHF